MEHEPVLHSIALLGQGMYGQLTAAGCSLLIGACTLQDESARDLLSKTAIEQIISTAFVETEDRLRAVSVDSMQGCT